VNATDSHRHSLTTVNYMTVNLLKGPPPPHTHRKESKIASVTSVNLRAEKGEFWRNAAEMFSFDPNPTTARKAWSSSTCLLYVDNSGGDGSLADGLAKNKFSTVILGLLSSKTTLNLC
jgi:hypothetical protein